MTAVVAKAPITRKLFGIVGVIALALTVSACAPEGDEQSNPPVQDAQTQDAQTQDALTQENQSPETENSEPITTEPSARTQDASCEWEIAGPKPNATPADGQEGKLEDVLVGSWQHTYFDSGNGFEEVSNDIRYVFPSTSEMIYCQDVPGVTDQAENNSGFKLEGTDLVLPGGHPGFAATDWNDNVLMLHNNFDGSTYLLQRR